MRFRQVVAGLVLVTYLPGCTGWHEVPGVQPEVIGMARVVRAMLKDGQAIELEMPKIVGDSIVGSRMVVRGYEPPRRVRISVALGDVARMETGGGGGSFLFLGLLLFGAVFTGATSLSGWSSR